MTDEQGCTIRGMAIHTVISTLRLTTYCVVIYTVWRAEQTLPRVASHPKPQGPCASSCTAPGTCTVIKIHRC